MFYKKLQTHFQMLVLTKVITQVLGWLWPAHQAAGTSLISSSHSSYFFPFHFPTPATYFSGGASTLTKVSPLKTWQIRGAAPPTLRGRPSASKHAAFLGCFRLVGSSPPSCQGIFRILLCRSADKVLAFLFIHK